MGKVAAGSVTISVVVVSHNEGEYLRLTVENLAANFSQNTEIIVVDDCSTDGSSADLESVAEFVVVVRLTARLGVSAARNLGARRSRGRIIVFSDAHVEVVGDWQTPLIRALGGADVGAVGPVLSSMCEREAKGYGLRFVDDALNVEWLPCKGPYPYPVPLLGGFFFAIHRDVFDAIYGFDTGMKLWGIEDLEFCIRLWTHGYRCLLVPAVDVAHLDRGGDVSCPAYQRDWVIAIHNMLRLGLLHFGVGRLQRLVKCYARDPQFPAAFALLVSSDVWERRMALARSRWYDDGWFFKKFKMK